MSSQSRSITRITSIIAGVIAVTITVLIPSGFFTISYQYLLGSLDAQAEISARSVSGLIMQNPKMWRFEQIRLEELLERRTRQDEPEARRIVDPQSNVIVESVDHLQSPVVSRSHDIYDAGAVVAKIEISRSLAPLLRNTVFIAFGSLLTGMLVFIVLRILPLRAIRRAHQSLEESEKHYRSLYDSMKEGMALHRITYDKDGNPVSFTVVDINPASELFLGLERIDIIGKAGPELFGEEIMDHFPEMVWVADTGKSLMFEMALPKTNKVFTVSVFSPEKGLFATLLEDITERKKSDEQIQKLAYYDNLTGLPNRSLLLDRLNQALARAVRDNGRLAVLFIDLDRFKVINDTLGHAYGDLLLIQVAQRLQKCVRSSDTLARLGGDEFVVLISSIGEEFNVAHIAQHLLENINASYRVSGRDIYTTASIGIALFPEDGLDTEILLRNADMAMYAAKDGGRNGFNFYSQEMNRKAHERMELETSLRHALEHEEFYLEFQPIVNARNGRLVGAEALVRWQHPEWGRIMPDRFIPVAEDSGLIIPLGEWVLSNVCRKMKEWFGAGCPQFRMSVNVSGQQFARSDISDIVYAVLTETGIDPRCLELELTETSLMANADATVKTLFKLKELDLSIAVDDFGAGYSSLGYLKNFPIDRIKIDRSFVRDVCNNPDDRAIVEAIIAIASKLNLDVIAEGVESSEQCTFLMNCGCEEIQGFYFYRPLSEDKFVELLKESKGFQFPGLKSVTETALSGSHLVL